MFVWLVVSEVGCLALFAVFRVNEVLFALWLMRFGVDLFALTLVWFYLLFGFVLVLVLAFVCYVV